IPDGADMDSFSTEALEVIYSCDIGVYNLSLSFANRLAEFTDLSYVSIEDLNERQDSPYIVLLGRPNASGNAIEKLIYELLNDTGDVLDEMLVPGARALAVRYGVWTPTQTVVIMTEANELDVYTVLSALRGREVTILPNYARLDYSTPSPPIIAYQAFYSIAEIDFVKQTDAIVHLAGVVSSSFSIIVHRYNQTTTPTILSGSNGLVEGDQAVGKYLEVGITGGLVVNEALIQIYYRNSDIDLTGDGTLGQLGDLNETTLCLYWYDQQSATWVKLSEEIDWVLAWGLNTTDVELYGEQYAGFIWAHVMHLSLFGMAGELIGVDFVSPYSPYIWIILGCVAVVAAIVIKRRRTRKSYDNQLGLLHSLRE
ncbi:MAG: hypothetical protein JW779_16110, partial [Candidatus Thorarchaeota archaeon]|nr:hypothetical protein [Candidatus Thorarchaeota archaeon]